MRVFIQDKKCKQDEGYDQDDQPVIQEEVAFELSSSALSSAGKLESPERLIGSFFG